MVPQGATARLQVLSPFDLEATVRLLQRRPVDRIDVWNQGRYRRVLTVRGERLLCTVRNRRTIDDPNLELRIEPRPYRAAFNEAERSVREILGLDLEPGFEVPGLRHPKLAVIANALRGARPPRFPQLFESFGRIIPYQQVSLDSGSAMVSRFVERFGQRVDTEDGPVWSFPEAAVVAAAPRRRFAGVGLSQNKADSLRRLAKMIATGELEERDLRSLPNQAALRHLDALPGVGPWTAALVLLRGMGRMDVFPSGDAGVLKGLRRLFGERAPLDELIQKAGDRRGYLYFYSLGAQLLEKGLIGTALGPRAERPRSYLACSVVSL